MLRPDLAAESYYEKFDIVPSQMRPLMLQGRVMITNWHAFAPESAHTEGGKNYAVVDKGEEGPDAFARRVLKELYGLGEVLVLNDEAHHAYRPAPPEIAAKSWLYAGPATMTLGAQWQERFQLKQEAKPGQTGVPPVIIVVCDNTDMAQVFFEKLSGETQEEMTEIEGDDETEVEATESKKKTKVRKIRRFNTAGLPFPELANSKERTVTLRIDSKLLAEAEAGEGNTKQQEAEKLRQIIASVGQPGTVGEHIRCVVSVQMLTEGWDANNVTQILGLRAFGSQLLCEQVVGRGLRRISYDIAPVTKMLRPEYVDVYGIPFSVIPFKGRASKQPEPDDKPVTQVKALPERAAMEMRFPNVEGYVLELKRNLVRCDLPKVEQLRIRPMQNPMAVFVQPQVGVREGHVGSPSFKTELQNRDTYYATVRPVQMSTVPVPVRAVAPASASARRAIPSRRLRAENRLEVTTKEVVGDILGDDRFVGSECVKVGGAKLCGDLEGDVHELAEMKVVIRARKVVPKRGDVVL